MADPTFDAEQLAELWARITETGKKMIDSAALRSWNNGIDAMFQRCETYPQYTHLAVTVNRLPYNGWYETPGESARNNKLLEHATPEQILQALAYEQETPESRWNVTAHVLTHATAEQLTGPVIEQLPWDDRFHDLTTKPDARAVDGDQLRHHAIEHVQQTMLAGDKNAWDMFCGIAAPGTLIGETAEPANAIEQQTGPAQPNKQTTHSRNRRRANQTHTKGPVVPARPATP